MADNHKIIAIDVDDVLAASAEGFIAYSNKRWGTNLEVEDYQEHWGELWKVDHDEVLIRAEEMHTPHVMGNYQHVDAAVPVLRKLAARYRLVVVTSRRSTIMRETTEWLARHYAGIFSDVVFAGIFDGKITEASFVKTKADTLQELGAAYLVDDQLKHCLGAAERGIDCLLFGNYTWNKADSLPDGVTRCVDWAAVEAYFDGRDG